MKDCSLADFAIEAIYSGYTIEWIKDENNNSWLSQMSLPYWLEIGICKKKVNLRESEEYLTKVAIFGDEKISQKAFQKLQTSICESPKCIDNLIVVNNLSKLIVYYKQMNVHPRALFLLNKYNEKINHKYNSEMIKKEWNEKITNYQKLCKDNCFLFGKKLESHNYIDIPFPGNNTVLKNIKKKLDKYVN